MDINTFLSEAYPAIFERAVDIFPEFAFEPLPAGKGYRSTNRLKIDGSEGQKVGGVYYYAHSLYGLKDYTRGFISIYAYLKQRDELSDEQVLDRISELSGKVFVGRSRSPEEEAAHRLLVRRSELMEEANNFFINCLSHKDNPHAQTPRAAELRNYLLHQRRYPVSILRLPEAEFHPHQAHLKMELGFIPSRKILHEHLESCGFTKDEIFAALFLPSGVGYSNNLTIPYRNKLGMIRGFAFRDTKHYDTNKNPKYLYSVGLERGSILFGLRKRKNADWILVEGMLDAMNASAQGIEGVVAIGGASLTNGQLEELLHNNPQSITLCLDNDHAGQIGTERALEKLLPHSNRIRLYVAQMPDGIKDLDELIVKQGVEATKQVLHHADSVASYYHQKMLQEAQALEQDKEGKLSDKDFDKMLGRVVETEILLQNPLDIHRFRQLAFESFSSYTFNAEVLAFKSEEIREIQRQKEYLEQLVKLNRQADDALVKGRVNEAEKLFSERFKELKQGSNIQKFLPLRLQPDEAKIKEAFANMPPSIDSGYSFSLPEEQPLLLPYGAISFFCAPTSHGKTTMLLNLSLNIAQRYPEKQIHFFSYEEAQQAIYLKLLNAHLDLDVSSNNSQALEQYFRSNTLQSIFPAAEPEFLLRKEAFFRNYVAQQRLFVHYVEYSAAELIDAIHFLKKQGEVGAVVIDYMQLLQLDDHKKGRLSRQEELKQICMDLKDCAVDTGLPIILGAQFNREVTNHFRIHATKIGEAGDIERIASVVVGMWNNDFDPFGLQLGEEMQMDEVRQPNTIWAKLLKNRGGKVGGTALFPYNGNRGKIYPTANSTNGVGTTKNIKAIKF